MTYQKASSPVCVWRLFSPPSLTTCTWTFIRSLLQTVTVFLTPSNSGVWYLNSLDSCDMVHLVRRIFLRVFRFGESGQGRWALVTLPGSHFARCRWRFTPQYNTYAFSAWSLYFMLKPRRVP